MYTVLPGPVGLMLVIGSGSSLIGWSQRAQIIGGLLS